MAGSTIGNAPSGENTSPDGTEKIPLSGSKFIQIANLIVRKLRETAGPTTLSMGAVSDGQFLKRSSTNVVGSGVTSADVSGTTTNDSATTGYIGEYVEGSVAEASKISLTTNTTSGNNNCLAERIQTSCSGYAYIQTSHVSNSVSTKRILM